MPSSSDLGSVRTFPQLVAYLRDELDWPIERADFEDLTFDYSAEELGIDHRNAAKIEEIKRLRPLSTSQPWGIFFVKFEPKTLPVVALRRILSSVVLKKRAASGTSDRGAWAPGDLLFISNFGHGDERQISFAHFASSPGQGELPTLKVLGWDSQNTKLHLDYVADQLEQKLTWPTDESDHDRWRSEWRSAFTLQHREVIRTSRLLAERLAELARVIRERINAVLEVETEDGPVTRLMDSFRRSLVHDLQPDDFADMYAQTVAYGLLSTRIANPAQSAEEPFNSRMHISPFVTELLSTFLRSDNQADATGDGQDLNFDELGVGEVVDLLDRTNIEAVLRDFGDRNPLEDPVIHFYELFLTEYDAKKRAQRGVFYTPRPAVSFIVRSIDWLLRQQFHLEDGLADTATWRDVASRVGFEIPVGVDPNTEFVQILDPATGTGTFLVEIIDLVHQRMVERWTSAGRAAEIADLWNQFVTQHLLPRLHGYELLMAPYAIAHLKVGLKLHETGYRFDTTERARIYLTDALEGPQTFSDRLEFAVPALGHEAQAVNTIKRSHHFTVVLGNPPYSNYSANLSTHARSIVDKYRTFGAERIQERNPLQFERNLQDDFVKFVAIAEEQIARSGIGVLGYITNATMLGSPSLRGMREHLLQTFSTLFELHLHGGVNESRPGDQNIFDISQAVAIHLYSRTGDDGSNALSYGELWGARSKKYESLLAKDVSSSDWVQVLPGQETRSFLPHDERGTYRTVRLDTAFVRFGAGIKTNRDAVAIGLTDDDLVVAVREYTERRMAPSRIRKRIRSVLYRPFDVRRICYDAEIVASRSLPTMQHMTAGENLGLLASSSWTTPDRFSVNVSRCMVEMKAGTHDRGTTLFPLFRYEDFMGTLSRVSNLHPEFLRIWRGMLGPDDRSEDEAAIEIFEWIYGICHSREYRERHRSMLSEGFPLVLFPGSRDVLRAVSGVGRKLIRAHLLDWPPPDEVVGRYEGPNAPTVGRVAWADESVYIDAPPSGRSIPTGSECPRFVEIPKEVWDFEIGGYPVLYKWLKDRKGGHLDRDGVDHYLRITEAIRRTIRLMVEVDERVAENGGWPGAFAPIANGPSGS